MARIPDHKSNRFKSGDHLVICQRTSRVVYASECVREWNGLLVHRSVYEPKHPQLDLKARPERKAAGPFNSQTADVYVGGDYIDAGYFEPGYFGQS